MATSSEIDAVRWRVSTLAWNVSQGWEIPTNAQTVDDFRTLLDEVARLRRVVDRLRRELDFLNQPER